jgi:hypothetical protein
MLSVVKGIWHFMSGCCPRQFTFWLMQITTIEKDILRMLSVLDLEELLVLFEGRCNGMRILLKVIVVKAANKII